LVLTPFSKNGVFASDAVISACFSFGAVTNDPPAALSRPAAPSVRRLFTSALPAASVSRSLTTSA